MGQRRVKRTNRKPSFFWQGVLILAPMLVLAKLGALALSQDKRMAQHEAELRAQDMAEEAAEKIWNELHEFRETTLTNQHGQKMTVTFRYKSPQNFYIAPSTERIEINSAGDLLFPPPYEPVPSPHLLDATQLSVGQRSLWEGARSDQTRAAIDVYCRFLLTNPPTNFAAAAEFEIGTLLAQTNRDAAVREFLILRHEFPTAVSESGLPMSALACLKAFKVERELKKFRTGDERAAAEDLMRCLLNHPSALTAELLRARDKTDEMALIPEAVRNNAEFEWNDQERLRRLYAAARPQLLRAVEKTKTTNQFFLRFPTQTSSSLFWVTLSNEKDEPATKGIRVVSVDLDERWLMTRVLTETGSVLLCRSEPTVFKAVQAELERVRKPEYLDASVRIADQDVVPASSLRTLQYVSGGKGGGQFWKRNHTTNALAVLASARREENGRTLLAVNIHLVSPEMLYAQQEQRAFLFKLLIGASALASIIGFFFAWRAFRKQLRLAEMKSNFVSSVSHELRAPIASVRLMAEGLERGKISEPAKQQEYFHFITQECRRLSAMIENVLDFARIEQGRKEYEFEPTDVVALVATTVKLMEPYAAERGVKLRIADCGLKIGKQGAELAAPDATAIECDSPSPWGEGRGAGEQIVADIDGPAIQQALVNLIDNAIKHSPSGEEVLIELEFPNPQSEIRNLKLSVSDHGPGIPPTEHEKIFERFYRLGSELRRETPGVGIGLSIVKHVVEAHGGRVRVENEVAKGSRFTVELPLTAETRRRREEL